MTITKQHGDPKVGRDRGRLLPGVKVIGRKKGTPNKITREAKEIGLAVANELSLSAWVKLSPRNETLFWTVIYPKLIDQTVSHRGGVDLNVSWFE